MWFSVVASSWIRQLRFGHLPLQHALVKSQSLSSSVFQDSHRERHPLFGSLLHIEGLLHAGAPCIGFSLRSGCAVTPLENMTRCSHSWRFSGSWDFFASENGKAVLVLWASQPQPAHRKTSHYFFSPFLLPMSSQKLITDSFYWLLLIISSCPHKPL